MNKKKGSGCGTLVFIFLFGMVILYIYDHTNISAVFDYFQEDEETDIVSDVFDFFRSPEELEIGSYDGFYFNQLETENQQILYTALETCFSEMDESIEVKAEVNFVYSQEFTSILEAVLADYPEYFWVDNCMVQSGEREGYVIISPVYTCTPEEAAERKQEIDSIVDPICESLESASDYDKVKTVYDFLIDRTAYDLEYVGTSIYELFHDGRAVCEGYARATQYMLDKMDVEAIYVTGSGSSDMAMYRTDGGHAWNIVSVEGMYYQLDTTWGDPYYEDGHQERLYDYFLVTTEDIRGDHIEDIFVDYPECTSNAYNYYIVNGLYLESYDEAAIQNLLSTVVSSGEKVSFRFADSNLLQTAEYELFTNNRIWDLTGNILGSSQNSGVVYHSVNDTVNTMTIWYEWD